VIDAGSAPAARGEEARGGDLAEPMGVRRARERVDERANWVTASSAPPPPSNPGRFSLAVQPGAPSSRSPSSKIRPSGRVGGRGGRCSRSRRSPRPFPSQPLGCGGVGRRARAARRCVNELGVRPFRRHRRVRRASCGAKRGVSCGCRAAPLALAVPVVEPGLGLEHRLIAVRARPEPDLPAVGIVDDGQR
jgi:hypothetical protein